MLNELRELLRIGAWNRVCLLDSRSELRAHCGAERTGRFADWLSYLCWDDVMCWAHSLSCAKVCSYCGNGSLLRAFTMDRMEILKTL